MNNDGWKSWYWRGTINGNRRQVTFGYYPTMKLREARSIVAEFQVAAAEGIGPEDLAWPPGPTFEQAARATFGYLSPSWPVGTLEDEAIRPLERYAYPKIGKVLVKDIAKWHVMWCLDPIWRTHPDAAKRVLKWACLVSDFLEVSPRAARRHKDFDKDHIAYVMDRMLQEGPCLEGETPC